MVPSSRRSRREACGLRGRRGRRMRGAGRATGVACRACCCRRGGAGLARSRRGRGSPRRRAGSKPSWRARRRIRGRPSARRRSHSSTATAPRALEDYLVTLEEVGVGAASAAAVLAPVAATRAGELLEEVPGAVLARERVEARLLALPRDRFPWQARVELARIGDRIARRRGDPALLEELARAGAALVRSFSSAAPAACRTSTSRIRCRAP